MSSLRNRMVYLVRGEGPDLAILLANNIQSK